MVFNNKLMYYFINLPVIKFNNILINIFNYNNIKTMNMIYN